MIDDALSIVERNAFDALRRDNTYTDSNGIIRCAVCNEPRMVFIAEIGKNLPVICSCYDRKQKEEQQKEIVMKVKQKAESSPFYDNSYNKDTFSNDDSQECVVSKQCKAFVEHWEEVKHMGAGLIISGPLGTGKSFYAAAIVNAIKDKGISAIIVTTSRFISIVQSSKSPQAMIDDLNTFQLVALDDLGAERDSDYAVELLENFVNGRVLKKLPMVVTTNHTGAQLNNPSDMRYARIFDRIMVMCPRPIVLNGKSRRIDQREERSQWMKDILGI